jgi:diguanylate cyclase (GGDEF)-like protein
MLDVDGLKAFNDSKGHVAGDRLLARIAELISGQLRQSDHAFRFAGDEFIILLPETDLETAQGVAERIRISVENQTGSTLSLGVSCKQRNMRGLDDLIRSADAGLYRAKGRGRNQIASMREQS